MFLSLASHLKYVLLKNQTIWSPNSHDLAEIFISTGFFISIGFLQQVEQSCSVYKLWKNCMILNGKNWK